MEANGVSLVDGRLVLDMTKEWICSWRIYCQECGKVSAATGRDAYPLASARAAWHLRIDHGVDAETAYSMVTLARLDRVALHQIGDAEEQDETTWHEQVGTEVHGRPGTRAATGASRPDPVSPAQP